MTEDREPRLSAPKAEEIFVRELYQQNFFACLFSGMKKRANYQIPTLAVVLDPRTFRHIALEYNPEFLAREYERHPMLFRFSLAHEGAHIVLRHIPRWHMVLKEQVFSSHDHRLFNIAADLAANSLCLPCVAPRGKFHNTWERNSYVEEFRREHLSNDCFPDKFQLDWGLTFEQYYQLLKDKFPTEESLESSGLRVAIVGPSGEGEGNAQGKTMEELEQEFDLIIVKAPPKKTPRDREEDKEAQIGAQAEREKEARAKAEGDPVPEAPPDPGKEKKPSKATIVHEHQWMEDSLLDEEEGREDPTCHEGDMGWGAPHHIGPDLLDAILADRIEKAMETFESRNGRGSLPGNLRDHLPNVRGIIPAAIPWQSLVKRIMARHNHQSDLELFTRPNYRLMHLETQGVFPYPSWMQQPGMKVGVIRDTSGSMGTKEMMEILSVIFSYLKAFPASSVHLIDADTHVHKVWEIKSAKDCPSDAHGRGGTDFVQPIAYVEEHLKPDVIFYGTDGYGRAPDRKPKTPIIWCMTRHSHVPASYGAAVQISTGKILRRQ